MSAATLAHDPFTRHRAQNGCGSMVRINPGGHYVSRDESELLVTVLGSCVAACIRDPVAGVGGMNHFMLPESGNGAWGKSSASLRFGNFAMEQLINDILCLGGRRQNLEIKAFGGADLIGSGSLIGPRNADFVEAYLKDEGLRMTAADLRGTHARRIQYSPATGLVRMLELRLDEPCVAIEVHRYPISLHTGAVSDSMESFG